MNKDRIYTIAAFFSLFVIAIVAIVNFNVYKDNTNYSGIFYTNDYYPDAMDEKDVYLSLNGEPTSIQCPQIELERSNKGLIYLTFTGKKYKKDLYFLNNSDISSNKNDITLTDKTWTGVDGLAIICGLTDETAAKKKGAIKFWVKKGDEKYAEIIAPFNFNFATSNITDENTISILDTAGTTKITFNAVANWFCAGVQSKVGDGWIDHGVYAEEESENNAHTTIIGNTNNAKVKGGLAGNIIGYANENTTVLIEVKNASGNWAKLSVKNWLTKD